MARYKRVLIKLSGQAVAGAQSSGFSAAALDHLAREVLAARELGVEVGIVIGGGNVFRGRSADDWGIDRVEADNIGMLGTVINAILLRGRLTALSEYDIRVMTAFPITSIAEPFIRLRATHHLEKGKIVILAGGIGQPFVTTDYPSVQRAAEIDAEAILVAKHGADGVFDSDPNVNPDARRFRTISYDEVLSRGLRVMDQAAFILARDEKLPLHVFDIDATGTIAALCNGEEHGTLIAANVETVYAD
ncbi:UMP kinase [Tenggerimyces flavus]|uniref:Uridylate kinase n=1 Tax=Tenggerimyces flavus TaxID=1708749 RepID=A0ABV7YII1_9ACTN|nr:UMP kinase [Tenggerimyces flavus]MBM7787392.1 uridylate kinase [Tenggerimyces flavus]